MTSGDYHRRVSHAPLALVIPLVVVLAVLAVPSLIAARGGWSRRLERTGRLGVHSEASMASDEAFRMANRVAAPVVGGAGAVAAVAALLVVLLPVGTGLALTIGLIGILGSVALLMVAGSLGERAAQAVPRPARKPGGASCGGCACGGGGCSGLTKTEPAETTTA